MSITKEEEQQLELFKKIIEKVCITTNIKPVVVTVAITEMLVSILATRCKTTKELEQFSNSWFNDCYINAMHIMGPKLVRQYNQLRELEVRCPGAVKIMADIQNETDNSVQIVVVDKKNQSKDEIDRFLDENKDTTPVSTTKH